MYLVGSRGQCGGRRTGAALLVSAVVVLWLTAAAQAQTVVGYWRMEVDNDAAATGLSVPNQIGGGNPLTSTTASLALPVPGYLNAATSQITQIIDPLTLTTSPNTLALNGDADINGTVASYAALNTSSITVEGFFRTQEGTATLVSRQNGSLSGFLINNANNVTVTYIVNGASRTLSGTPGIDLDAPYTHVAFTYDATTGVGNLYANGVLRGTRTDAAGPLFAGTETTALAIGTQYDGAGLSSGSVTGVIDEVRITNAALTPAQFLQSAPEPGTFGLLTIGALGVLARRRRER